MKRIKSIYRNNNEEAFTSGNENNNLDVIVENWTGCFEMKINGRGEKKREEYNECDWCD